MNDARGAASGGRPFRATPTARTRVLSSWRRIGIAGAIGAMLLGGCATTPDFRPPEAPAVSAYTPTPLPAQTDSAPDAAGGAQRFLAGEDIPAEWWTLFRSDALDRLVRQGLAHSPTLAAAQATLRRAEEDLRAEVGVVSPSVDARLSATRQRFSPEAIGQPNLPSTVFNLYNASVGVSYTFDLTGGWRRQLEAVGAQVDYQAFQLEGAYVALTANIVTAAVREAALRAQIQATGEILAARRRELAIVERQYKLGGAARADVLTQRAELAQIEAGLLPLEKDLAVTRHQLSVLVGRFPGEAGMPAFRLEEMTLPSDLPVSVPSSLVRQRPDIRAAEALLHQAAAQVGVATANLYPRITLTGSYGPLANSAGDLIGDGTNIWSLGASLVQPLFRGGELSARRRAALAAYDQAAAQYRDTVLRAFQNVADTLRALELDARLLQAQVRAETAARDALELTRRSYTLGGTTFLALLNAERQYQQARVGLVQARAARYADTAALFQALGGGWWNRPAPLEAVPAQERKTQE